MRHDLFPRDSDDLFQRVSHRKPQFFSLAELNEAIRREGSLRHFKPGIEIHSKPKVFVLIR
jgi:hypothetical protein